VHGGGTNVLAVAQYRQPIAEPTHLRQPVRYEDDGDTLRLELGDKAAEPVDIPAG
jgi:hypothetical protein